jgi:hypothetical protein
MVWGQQKSYSLNCPLKKISKATYGDIIAPAKFEVFTAVTTKNVVFWNKTLSSYHTGNTLNLSYRAHPVKAGFFTTVNVENAVFWHIKTQFILDRKYINSPLRTSAG